MVFLFSRKTMKLNFDVVLFNLYFYYQNLLNDISAAFLTQKWKIISNTKPELRNNFLYL